MLAVATFPSPLAAAHPFTTAKTDTWVCCLLGHKVFKQLVTKMWVPSHPEVGGAGTDAPLATKCYSFLFSSRSGQEALFSPWQPALIPSTPCFCVAAWSPNRAYPGGKELVFPALIFQSRGGNKNMWRSQKGQKPGRPEERTETTQVSIIANVNHKITSKGVGEQLQVTQCHLATKKRCSTCLPCVTTTTQISWIWGLTDTTDLPERCQTTFSPGGFRSAETRHDILAHIHFWTQLILTCLLTAELQCH